MLAPLHSYKTPEFENYNIKTSAMALRDRKHATYYFRQHFTKVQHPES